MRWISRISFLNEGYPEVAIIETKPVGKRAYA
jgi:hypothetical protein